MNELYNVSIKENNKPTLTFLRYNTTGAQLYTTNNFVRRVSNCNGFIAINTGDEIVTVNDHVLYPGTPGTINGDSISFGGNAGEIFLGNISVVFAGGGTNPQVAIDQKFYILDKAVF
jgi:hypothetical protein